MWHEVVTAFNSATRFVLLIGRGQLHLNRGRVGAMYAINHDNYSIFRETWSPKTEGEKVVLVVRFRLRLIKSNPAGHWIFQRISILTTPFWSGMKGFRTKLWMVNPVTKDYLGVYEWRGLKAGQDYTDYLVPILKLVSVRNSVSAMVLANQEFESFLFEHKIPASSTNVAYQ